LVAMLVLIAACGTISMYFGLGNKI
jgi:hypothetical protein